MGTGEDISRIGSSPSIIISDGQVVAESPSYGKRRSWVERGPRFCEGCNSVKDEGWSATSGSFFCTSCWDAWNTVPSAPSEARRSKRHAEESGARPKRTRAMLCSLMGNGCGCCAPDGSDFAAYIEDDYYWKSLFYVQDLPELCGKGYSDAHCHLDIYFRNVKNGGVGWDCKQKLCKYWLDGGCPFGDTCDYAHGEDNLEPRPPLEKKDIEPYLMHYIGRRTANNTKTKSIADDSSDGPILQCLITNCCELETIEDTRVVLEVAQSVCPGTVFVTFGCHPHDYRMYTDELEAAFLSELDTFGSRVVAWGECGLDYCKNYYEATIPLERQRMMDVFARQARLAVKRKLPLVVHSRDAEADTLQVLKDNLPRDFKFHVHAYQGNLSMMNEAINFFPNCVFGVSTMILLANPSEGAVDVARACPLERLVLETDAPYLSNGSQDIPRLARRVAELKGLSPLHVMETASANCQRFYGIHRDTAA
eukprot:TRINITY_DN65556_c0_g1_i2.p1 TRINITY_DN65556_c0_g1~~TRINITY_DN65556_c0_g1_i2.p1  ORF type:complete len:495 (+),score=43.74 TRINITY_DN65556_c0_g1_i2:51-1487(+)